MNESTIYKLLNRTIELGESALKKGNYPIGALMSDSKGKILLEAENSSFTDEDPSAHAEAKLFRQLKKLNNPEELIMFSSLEPCIGCTFFLTYSKIRTIHVALKDEYRGGINTLGNLDVLKEDISDIKVYYEQFEDLKAKSKKLMYDFLISNGKNKSADKFK